MTESQGWFLIAAVWMVSFFLIRGPGQYADETSYVIAAIFVFCNAMGLWRSK